MLDPASLSAITFDCYGTLVDWERGIAEYVSPHLEREAPLAPPIATWLARWEDVQFALLSPWRPYSEVLVRSFEETNTSFALPSFSDGGPGLVRSIADWPPFADTAPSLKRLARRFRLGLVSNIDRSLLAQTLGTLLVPLATIVTAEDVEAYKPDSAPFRRVLERLRLDPSRVLHAAFGWRYDLAPARALGMRTCFVNRSGRPRPAGDAPDLEVPSLAALADALGV